MYDFHFGSKKQIEQNDEEFLIFVKRLLPRWINGIPDSECLAIYRLLNSSNKQKPILLETGCGASTLAMFLFCSFNNGRMYSWDTNGSKGSFLRSVITEAICRPLGINIFDTWNFIAFDSTNSHAGIPVLKELGERADFGFFDSWHTLDHLMNEIKCFEIVSNNKFIIALDDAHYQKKSDNFSYINLLREKLDLKPVKEPKDNICDPFHVEVERYLSSKYKKVKRIEDSFKKEFEQDIFYDYYKGERKAMNVHGMVDMSPHRFEAFTIEKE